MLAYADYGSLSTKDKSLPLTRSVIALSLMNISVNRIQLFRRSQNNKTSIDTCDYYYQSKVVVSAPTFYEVCWYIKSNSYYIY